MKVWNLAKKIIFSYKVFREWHTRKTHSCPNLWKAGRAPVPRRNPPASPGSRVEPTRWKSTSLALLYEATCIAEGWPAKLGVGIWWAWRSRKLPRIYPWLAQRRSRMESEAKANGSPWAHPCGSHHAGIRAKNKEAPSKSEWLPREPSSRLSLFPDSCCCCCWMASQTHTSTSAAWA